MKYFFYSIALAVACWIQPLPAQLSTPEYQPLAASWVGGSADEEMTGVRILADGRTVVAANLGSHLPGGVVPELLGSATAASSGCLLVFGADGQTLERMVRVADKVFQLDIDASDNLYLAAGQAGLLKLDAGVTQILWSASVSGEANKVDVAPDGTTAVLRNAADIGTTSSLPRIFVFDATGSEIVNFPGNGYTGDVALDAVNQRIFVIGYNNKGSGCNPVQVCYLRAFDYAANELWKNYDWPGTWLDDCDGDGWTNLMADTRGYVVELMPDGNLVCGFEAAGGNHIFKRVPNNDEDDFGGQDSLNLRTAVSLVGGDHYHQFYNTQAQHKTLVGVYESATGDLVRAQEFCTRFFDTRRNSVIGNTFRMQDGDISFDAEGRIYLTSSSAAGLPLEGDPIYEGMRPRPSWEQTYSGLSPQTYSGGAYLMVMSPGLDQRLLTMRLSGGEGRSVAVRNVPGSSEPRIAYVGQQSSLKTMSAFPAGGNLMSLFNPIQALHGGGKDAFYAVLGEPLASGPLEAPVLRFGNPVEGKALTFDSASGLQYQLQRATTLTGPWLDIGTPVAGDGSELELSLPEAIGATEFFRVEVTP